MTLGSDEILGPDEILNEALVGFTVCIGTALEDICSYSLTLGETYVPFEPDEAEPGLELPEDCEDGCNQAWVRVMSVGAKPSGSVNMEGNDCGVMLSAELEVGVLRCMNIPEGGEAPTETQVMAAAMQAMTDMLAIKDAAMACEVWEAIEIGQWQPSGPLGGQYGGTWMFTVEIDPACGLFVPDSPMRVCGMWTGNGPPPPVITGALDGDEYVDLLSGTVYELSL